jgi:orotidine-5'-phosphate decarboxylase
MCIVTPGIRLPADDPRDQARVATPQQTMRDGADYIVVGRPITGAADPSRAAKLFLQAIGEVLASRA